MNTSCKFIRAVAALVFVGSLSACGGGGSVPPQTANMPQGRREGPITQQKASSNCTLIDTVNPNSDFAGLGFTARSFTGGDHLNIDATGCTYGIYLTEGAKDLHIDHALVNGASRVAIFAEAVSGVTIDHTVVNGTSFGGPANASASNSSLGGIGLRGVTGSVRNTRIYNTNTFGMNIVANNACFGANPNAPCLQSNVTVDQTIIDNSKQTGDGFVVAGGPFPAQSIGSISHSTVIGPNLSALPGKSQLDIYGAQVGYMFDDASVKADFDASVNNQIGFNVYCSTGIATLQDLKNLHDRISFQTVAALPTSPQLQENQVLNVFSAAELNAVFPGIC